MHKKLILVDQDGPLADFDRGFVTQWRRQFPNHPVVLPEQRKHFKMEREYPAAFEHQVRSIYRAKGFYRNLPIVAGAKEGLLGLLEQGYEVRICTAPLTLYHNCVAEKFEWVEEHFGLEFTRRIILAKDKTVVGGEYLIDDKPEITGFRKDPSWKQIFYHAPYNAHVAGLRLYGWERFGELAL